MKNSILIGALAAAALAVGYFAGRANNAPASPVAAAEPAPTVAQPYVSPTAESEPAPASAFTPSPAAPPARPSPSRSAEPARPAAPDPVTATPAPPSVVRAEPKPEVQPKPVEPVVKTEAQPAPAPAPEPVAKPEPPKWVPKTVTIADGTLIPVRIGERVSTKTHQVGDSFTGYLAEPLIVDGWVIAERNATVEGKVVQSLEPGRVKGRSLVAVELTSLRTSDGQTLKLSTGSFEREAEKGTKDDATKVGVGAAVGAAIGAIAGGGKGAAVGAATGAGAGTGVVLATRGKHAELEPETKISFRLSVPVKVTERRKN